MNKMSDEQPPETADPESGTRRAGGAWARLTPEQRAERRRSRREARNAEGVVALVERDTEADSDEDAPLPGLAGDDPDGAPRAEPVAVVAEPEVVTPPSPEAATPEVAFRGNPAELEPQPEPLRRGLGGRRARQAVPGAAVTVTTLPMAGKARMKKRHWGLILSFLAVVVLPAAVTAGYLWLFAVDQYASTVAFSVRKEDSSSTLDMLGGLSAFTSASSSSDTDVLYSFIRSQELVERISKRLDLTAMYTRPVKQDPVFALWPGGSIEDLVDYWQRMVTVYYDPSTGLIEVRTLAFDPDEAQQISQEIYRESTEMINNLSAIARTDATRYAKQDLDEALDRLKSAREAVTEFRNRTQVVDPTSDVQGQMGLLTQLQTQLAQSMIDYDMLRATVKDSDPRVVQAKRRIEVIQERISAERLKFGPGGSGAVDGGTDYAAVVAEYERLNVDLRFAEAAYTNALSAYEGAKAEAQRQSRYLAAHVQPTRAESSRYPERGFLFLMVASFLLLAWTIGALVYYSLRDRH